MLEIGNVYRDTKEKACNSTYLEYIGSDILGCPYFKYVAGVRSYEEHNGRIFIGSNPYLYSVDEKEILPKRFNTY